MKIVKITALAAFIIGSFTVTAQEHKAPESKAPAAHSEAKPEAKPSNGNAEAMRRNFNYPNATNPATNNQPPYDKGKGRIESEHPKENKGSHYTRKAIEGKKD